MANEQAKRDNNISNSLLVVDETTGETKRLESKEIDSKTHLLTASLGGTFVPDAYDYIALTYVSAGNGEGEVETVTYKIGGSGGTTVATLTLAYTDSVLSSITKS